MNARSQIRSMYRPKSKADKARMIKWDRYSRFTEGHDTACKSLLPEGKQQIVPVRRNRGGVYRAATFGLTRDERLVDDALFLFNRGYVETLEEAFERAEKNNPKPDYEFKDERTVH